MNMKSFSGVTRRRGTSIAAAALSLWLSWLHLSIQL